jgi:hypothetical protein
VTRPLVAIVRWDHRDQVLGEASRAEAEQVPDLPQLECRVYVGDR